ncbi:hypothetical protein [Mycolicibacterium chlorophenolicum]|uniref:Uncharacterized protein n=1 Tax=Mycolicibacterium chlorophenolicum TaxID=37916 RepID=A0A0J6WH62_9MYCO|nr:hypothetical protein [Mycolicibacterium chlorophenolicum]KMO82590.1 hypothetical protein MCHLDSM_01213 [Mycolicibacterium chlorophenolicum]
MVRGGVLGGGLLATAAIIAAVGGRLHEGSIGPSLTRYAVIAGVLGAILLLIEILGRRHTDRQPRTYFYVSATRIQDGQALLITGPYATRDLAAGDIQRVRGELERRGLGPEYSWGVSESPDRFDGRLNAELGFQPA